MLNESISNNICRYIKWLYDFECYKYNLSTREELEAVVGKDRGASRPFTPWTMQGTPGENSSYHSSKSSLSCMHTGRKLAKTIVFGSSDLQPIFNSAKNSADIKFGSDQKSAENRLKQPIRTVHKFQRVVFICFLFICRWDKILKIIAHRPRLLLNK